MGAKGIVVFACGIAALAYYLHWLDQANQRGGALVSLLMVGMPLAAPLFFLKAAFLPYHLEAITAEWMIMGTVPFLNTQRNATLPPPPDYTELR
jgi:4-amino-4-deoxy-L-arabinose transferase-like glycosyltransferase